MYKCNQNSGLLFFPIVLYVLGTNLFLRIAAATVFSTASVHITRIIPPLNVGKSSITSQANVDYYLKSYSLLVNLTVPCGFSQIRMIHIHHYSTTTTFSVSQKVELWFMMPFVTTRIPKSKRN